MRLLPQIELFAVYVQSQVSKTTNCQSNATKGNSAAVAVY